MRIQYLSRKAFISYIILITLSIIAGLDNTDLAIYGRTRSIIALIELIMTVFLIINNKYSVRKLIVVTIVLSCSVLLYFTSGWPDFFFLVVMAIAFHSINYKNGFRILLITRLVMLSGIITLSLAGFLDTYARSLYKITTTVTGYGLGYTHPNRLASVMLLVSILYFCYLEGKLKKKNYLILILWMTLSFLITGSRTMIYCSLVYILLRLFIERASASRLKKKFDFLLVLSIPLITFVNIYVPLYYKELSNNYTNYLYWIDIYLNQRITYASRAIRLYDISFLGGINDFTEFFSMYEMGAIDNGYVRFLLLFGLLGTIIFVLFTTLSVKKLIERKKYYLVAVAITMALWASSENVLVSFALDIFPVFWSELMRKDEHLAPSIPRMRGKNI